MQGRESGRGSALTCSSIRLCIRGLRIKVKVVRKRTNMRSQRGQSYK